MKNSTALIAMALLVGATTSGSLYSSGTRKWPGEQAANAGTYYGETCTNTHHPEESSCDAERKRYR